MDVIKSRLQKGEDGTNSARVLLSKIWKEEGYRGVFRVSAVANYMSLGNSLTFLQGYWMSIAVWGWV
jgi:hypothetical protein